MSFLTVSLTYVVKKVVFLFSKQAEKRLEKGVSSAWKWINFKTKARSSHFKQLTELIEKMPFIYKNLDFDVLNGYVDVDDYEYNSIDLRTFKPRTTIIPEASSGSSIDSTGGQRPTSRQPQDPDSPTYPFIKVALKEKLQRSTKVVFLGGAGIGKTTFQRYHLLKLIKNKEQFEYCYENQSYLPFLVRLKFINNDIRFPIREYLLSNYGYLSGDKGKERLNTLARQGKLLLCLDGYDEIPFSRESEINYCQEELRYLICADTDSNHSRLALSKEAADFYLSIANSADNRIWLSSRMEFYQQHAIQGSLARPIESDIFGLELRGIGKRRAALVKKIFDRHRSTESAKELLNEQYFLDQLNENPGSELHKLSYNPLFLTVMCYNYTQKVLNTENYQIQIAADVETLIKECITLLLRDIDLKKARGLTPVERDIQNRTRNDFIEEKQKFLPFFAAQLFADNRTVFDLAYLIEKVRQFLNVYPEVSSKERILRGFGEDAREPHFADQLINCGIFVLSEVKQNIGHYDFPHQRFKEVLASEFFSDSNSDYLIDHAKDMQLSEVLYVFFRMSKDRNRALAKLLQRTAIEFDDDAYYQLTLINCLRQAPADYDPSPIIREFLVGTLRDNRRFKFAPDLKLFFKPDRDFIQLTVRQFKESWVNGNRAMLNLCYQILGSYYDELLTELLTSCFESTQNWDSERLLSMHIEFIGGHDPVLLQTLLQGSFDKLDLSNKQKIAAYCKALSKHQPNVMRTLLKGVFDWAINASMWNELTFCCEMLKKYQPMTLNQLFSDHLHDLIKKNRFHQVPRIFLDYFPKDEAFVEHLANDFERFVTSNKLFSMCLCSELLLLYNKERLRSLIRHQLLPAYKSGKGLAVQLTRSSQSIQELLEEFAEGKKYLRAISDFSELYPLIKVACGEIPYDDRLPSPEYCYIITHDTLRSLVRWFRKHGGELDSDVWDWLKECKYAVHFSPEFMNEVPSPIDLQLSKFILRISRLSYKSYATTMRGIDTVASPVPIVFFPDAM